MNKIDIFSFETVIPLLINCFDEICLNENFDTCLCWLFHFCIEKQEQTIGIVSLCKLLAIFSVNEASNGCAD
jgi:hypothetical protein